MSEMFVMRRANGDLFTEQIGGRLGIHVGSNEEVLGRYKERNPELTTFVATPLTRSLVSTIRKEFGEEGTWQFFLLAEDDPGADLEDGRPISVEEIFPGAGRPLQAAQIPL